MMQVSTEDQRETTSDRNWQENRETKKTGLDWSGHVLVTGAAFRVFLGSSYSHYKNILEYSNE